ncbi:MAG: glycosyltransferase family 9 protein [Methylacidiphilales bacterium]|nr:glycosyltransferase family 9 protein [Candidatus Methylacidiphilales bacterium]MDW8348996.1 glycosyltransferase family 9 protein [Verrucomicrobiae bacterium]
MNFPGLDPSWEYSHKVAHCLGLLKTWDLERCQDELRKGVGVLVVANTALGDTVLCTPLLAALAENLGRERVGFLVRHPNQSLYWDSPSVGDVFCVRGKYRGLGQLKVSLKGTNYRLALVANCTEPDLIPWLYWCGIRGFLRYRTRWSRFASWFANQHEMRRAGESDYATGHAVENNCAMARALGLTVKEEKIRLHINEQNPHGDRNPYFIIHPGASRESKCWPLERWAEIARKVFLSTGWDLVLTGNESEKALAERLSALSQSDGVHRVYNYCGELSLRELAALIRDGRIFLSGDTGPYHIAVAVGTPTVTLFAPTDRGSSIEACGPRGVDPSRHRVVQTRRVGELISSISFSEVWDEVRKVLVWL